MSENAPKPQSGAAPKPAPGAALEHAPGAAPKPTHHRLRAFRCERKDYLTHAIADFPLPVRAAYAFIMFVVGTFARLRWRTRFEGAEPFLDRAREGGTVIVMNHVSMIEPVVIVTWLWRHGVHVRPIYKSEFDRIAPARFFFPRVGGIPVKRGTADLAAIRAAKDALLRGECVLVYPEGTRIKTDEPAKIHGGFSMIAQMGRSDVTPMAVVGALDPHHTRPTHVRHPVIRIGEPVRFDDLPKGSRKERMAEMERVAWGRVLALRDALRKENPRLW